MVFGSRRMNNLRPRCNFCRVQIGAVRMVACGRSQQLVRTLTAAPRDRRSRWSRRTRPRSRAPSARRSSSTMRRSTERSCTCVSGSTWSSRSGPRSFSMRDDDVADAQAPARPLPFERRPVTPAIDEVGPQPSAVHAERGDGAVGGDEQRQHVEALGTVVAGERGLGAGGRRAPPRQDSGAVQGRPSISGSPSGPSVPCKASSRGRLRAVTTRSRRSRTWTTRSPTIPLVVTTARSSRSPASDLTG